MKYILTLIMTVFTILFFISCEKDPVATDDGEKYVVYDSVKSVIPKRIQFGKDKIYHFKLWFDTNYMKEDGFSPSAFFTLDGDTIPLELYDDGISDDSLRNDLAASNNVWSGGINAIDSLKLKEGEWSLNIQAELDGHQLKEFGEKIMGILVKRNSSPEIIQLTGIQQGDTLCSGFDSFPVVISIKDPDNDEAGYNDNQTLKLEIRNRDNIPKDFYFVRTDPMEDMTIQLDSTIAAGLKTNNRYALTFIAADLYGETDSLKFDYIRIENTAPSIYEIQYPDTIKTDTDGVFWVLTDIRDPQGSLSYQDIEKVELQLGTNYYELLDDGDYSISGDQIKNDGIYTIGFSYNAGQFGTFNFQVKAYDKAENISEPYDGTITLISSVSKIKFNGNTDENTHSYINPFGSR